MGSGVRNKETNTKTTILASSPRFNSFNCLQASWLPPSSEGGWLISTTTAQSPPYTRPAHAGTS